MTNQRHKFIIKFNFWLENFLDCIINLEVVNCIDNEIRNQNVIKILIYEIEILIASNLWTIVFFKII